MTEYLFCVLCHIKCSDTEDVHKSGAVLLDCCIEENHLQLLNHSPCLLAATANEDGNL